MSPLLRSALLCTTVMSAASVSLAEAQQQPPANICEAEIEFHQFDFWIGDWTVYNNVNGNLAGQNHIEAREGGCALVERWTANAGGTGMSVNFYDNITKKCARSGWRRITRLISEGD